MANALEKISQLIFYFFLFSIDGFTRTFPEILKELQIKMPDSIAKMLATSFQDSSLVYFVNESTKLQKTMMFIG